MEQKKPRILYIDDDAMLRDLLSKKLIDNNFEPLCIEEGSQAVLITKREQPDAIILDMMLPGKDGFLILKELKENPETKDIPVVAYSDRSDQIEMDKALAAGVVKYFVKALTELDEIVEELHRIVDT